jgi:hypothetical protein
MASDPSVRPSTLNEINQQISIRAFELLSYLAPRTWTDARRIVYSPIDEFESAIEIFEGTLSLQKPEHLQVPFAYFTRYTGQAVGSTYDFARRPWAEWISTYARQIPRADVQIKFIPATFQYQLKIFDNRVEKMESLIDAELHKGVREKSKKYHYASDVLGISAPYTILWGNPQYDQNPNLKQKLQERGRLYSVVIPFEVYCVIGESLPVKRIEQINVGLYHRRGTGRPVPNEEDKIEEFMIDSNTEI